MTQGRSPTIVLPPLVPTKSRALGSPGLPLIISLIILPHTPLNPLCALTFAGRSMNDEFQTQESAQPRRIQSNSCSYAPESQSHWVIFDRRRLKAPSICNWSTSANLHFPSQKSRRR